ncbi:unnamed protein product [Blepharisma stoltei]|uniref:Reverse transcriptase zinc-binding domain-containing protein n=1 Tax=Blepharisma stoltei TaxID=1481888 RepID=A0AAU9J5W0_9CILI|nr:unnamed protein product [Blepharisma stoltei]
MHRYNSRQIKLIDAKTWKNTLKEAMKRLNQLELESRLRKETFKTTKLYRWATEGMETTQIALYVVMNSHMETAIGAMHRMRAGFNSSNECAFTRHLCSNPKCTTCEIAESEEHILVDCPLYAGHRKEMIEGIVKALQGLAEEEIAPLLRNWQTPQPTSPQAQPPPAPQTIDPPHVPQAVQLQHPSQTPQNIQSLQSPQSDQLPLHLKSPQSLHSAQVQSSHPKSSQSLQAVQVQHSAQAIGASQSLNPTQSLQAPQTIQLSHLESQQSLQPKQVQHSTQVLMHPSQLLQVSQPIQTPHSDSLQSMQSLQMQHSTQAQSSLAPQATTPSHTPQAIQLQHPTQTPRNLRTLQSSQSDQLPPHLETPQPLQSTQVQSSRSRSPQSLQTVQVQYSAQTTSASQSLHPPQPLQAPQTVQSLCSESLQSKQIQHSIQEQNVPHSLHPLQLLQVSQPIQTLHSGILQSLQSSQTLHSTQTTIQVPQPLHPSQPLQATHLARPIQAPQLKQPIRSESPQPLQSTGAQHLAQTLLMMQSTHPAPLPSQSTHSPHPTQQMHPLQVLQTEQVTQVTLHPWQELQPVLELDELNLEDMIQGWMEQDWVVADSQMEMKQSRPVQSTQEDPQRTPTNLAAPIYWSNGDNAGSARDEDEEVEDAGNVKLLDILLCSCRYERIAYSWIERGKRDVVQEIDRIVKLYHMEILKERAAMHITFKDAPVMTQRKITTWIKIDP